MNQRLSDVAAIAEIIASVAVVFSLIFVGLQISDANRETNAATLQAAADSELFTTATIVRHAGTWDKVINGEPLSSGEELRTGIVLYKMTMVESENRYQQYVSGYISAQSWESSLISLQAMVKLPIYTVWRDTPGAIGHSAAFLELADSLAEKSPNK
jgi:hypothetical protein